MAGRRFGALAILVLGGCGGGAATGAEPETAGPSERTATGSHGSAANEKTEPATGAGESAPSDGAAASGESVVSTLEGEDLQSVLQSVLSDPELLDHLHLAKPGRAPLNISGPNLPTKLKVIAGSHEVKVVDEPTSKKAVLVFTKIERTGEQVRLHYRFDVEGLKGSATVSYKNGHWELASNRVIEK